MRLSRKLFSPLLLLSVSVTIIFIIGAHSASQQSRSQKSQEKLLRVQATLREASHAGLQLSEALQDVLVLSVSPPEEVEPTNDLAYTKARGNYETRLREWEKLEEKLLASFSSGHQSKKITSIQAAVELLRTRGRAVVARDRERNSHPELHRSLDLNQRWKNQWALIFDDLSQDISKKQTAERNTIKTLSSRQLALFLLLPVLLAATTLIFYFNTDRHLTRPLQALQRMTNALATGERKIPSASTGGEEMKQISNNIWCFATESQAEQIRASEQLTRRSTALKAIKEQEIQYRNIVENLGDGLLMHDLNGTVLFANPQMSTLLKYAPEDFINASIPNIETHHTLSELQERWSQLELAQAKNFETTFTRKDQSTLPVKIRTSLFESGGRPYVICAARECANELQSQPNPTQHELQTGNAQKLQAIGVLSSEIAHDFNNILTPLTAYALLVHNELAEGSRCQQRVKRIMEAAQRARDLVQQILTFSDQKEEDRQPIRIPHLVDEVLGLIRASVPSTIEIRNLADDSNAMVLANPTHIHQILLNLCANAAYAMKGALGFLEISTVCVGKDALPNKKQTLMNAEEYVRISIRDTGPGIRPKVQEKIFEPWFTTKSIDKENGSGLGLTVVKRIVTAYGGDIQVESKLNAGTTFHIFLPCIKPKSTRMISDRNKEQNDQMSSAPDTPEDTKHILIVDDEKSVSLLIKDAVRRMGYQVTTKSTSLTALESFKRHPQEYDLLITELDLPQMSGDHLAKEVLKIRSDLPIILTSNSKSEEELKSLKVPAIHWTRTKPLNVLEITQIVRQALNMSKKKAKQLTLVA